MSGDLKNPSVNIPNGSLAAIGTGYVLFLIEQQYYAVYISIFKSKCLTNTSVPANLNSLTTVIVIYCGADI